MFINIKKIVIISILILGFSIITILFLSNRSYAYDEEAQKFWDNHNIHFSPPFISYCVLIPRNEIIFNAMPYTKISVSTFWKHIVWANISYELGIQTYYWHKFSTEKQNILNSTREEKKLGNTWEIFHFTMSASYNFPITHWLLIHLGFGGIFGFFTDGNLFIEDGYRFNDNGIFIRGGISYAFEEDFMLNAEYIFTFIHQYTDWHGINASIYLIW